MGLVGLGGLYFYFSGAMDDPDKIAKSLEGFGVGASAVALFSRVGGGIFTKSADVGADLVGKIEAGIPEDDPRNPGVIADNVGDNVGDIAGMGSDIFESYLWSNDRINGYCSYLWQYRSNVSAPMVSSRDFLLFTRNTYCTNTSF